MSAVFWRAHFRGPPWLGDNAILLLGQHRRQVSDIIADPLWIGGEICAYLGAVGETVILPQMCDCVQPAQIMDPEAIQFRVCRSVKLIQNQNLTATHLR